MDFKFIGWCKEGSHDKVWVSFATEGNVYCAWGRRGGKLSFKCHGKDTVWSTARHNINLLKQAKIKKGYKEVDEFVLFTLFPDFKERVEDELLMSQLGGKVK